MITMHVNENENWDVLVNGTPITTCQRGISHIACSIWYVGHMASKTLVNTGSGNRTLPAISYDPHR